MIATDMLQRVGTYLKFFYEQLPRTFVYGNQKIRAGYFLKKYSFNLEDNQNVSTFSAPFTPCRQRPSENFKILVIKFS
jgi:hypothetical protein